MITLEWVSEEMVQSITQGDESTVTYSDWSTYKLETGDQGFGITSLDVMFLVTDDFNLDGETMMVRMWIGQDLQRYHQTQQMG